MDNKTIRKRIRQLKLEIEALLKARDYIAPFIYNRRMGKLNSEWHSLFNQIKRSKGYGRKI